MYKLSETSIYRRIKKFSETLQESVDHFIKRRKEKQNDR